MISSLLDAVVVVIGQTELEGIDSVFVKKFLGGDLSVGDLNPSYLVAKLLTASPFAGLKNGSVPASSIKLFNLRSMPKTQPVSRLNSSRIGLRCVFKSSVEAARSVGLGCIDPSLSSLCLLSRASSSRFAISVGVSIYRFSAFFGFGISDIESTAIPPSSSSEDTSVFVSVSELARVEGAAWCNDFSRAVTLSVRAVMRSIIVRSAVRKTSMERTTSSKDDMAGWLVTPDGVVGVGDSAAGDIDGEATDG